MDEIMRDEPYKVLVRTDGAGRVLEVNSSAFVEDTDGWTQIDSGYGDRFHHAQNNYFPMPLMDERGVCRYVLTDDAVRERTPEEMDADYTPPAPPADQTEQLRERIDHVEKMLNDYETAYETGVNEA